MAGTEPEKRKLTFNSPDDIVAEARSLYENGYVSNGNWSLGQTCYHLAEWTRFPIDGFPTPPWFIRAIFGFMRMTGYAKKMADKIMAEGFSGGMATAPQTVPDADKVNDENGLKALEEVVSRMKNHTGTLHKSPLFGEMDKATYWKVSLLHAEHHLGYLEPEN